MTTPASDSELRLWLQLKCAKGVGPKTVTSLIEHFETIEGIFGAGPEAFDPIRGKKKTHSAIHAPEATEKAAERFEQLADLEIQILWRTHPDYPSRLARINNPPTLLFVRGTLPATEQVVAIVGSRNPSEEGATIAYDWAAAFARAGIAVVSGLARGIDGAAHRGAVSADGPTIAVLGCGPDIVYPPEHEELADEILAHGGAIVSEFWPGMPPDSNLFPVRNRTIAGLAECTVVVEAAAQSGALLTAADAREHGRDVFAVPGPLSRQTSAGTNTLLQRGAQIALSADDIIKRMGGRPIDPIRTPAPNLPDDLATLYALLDRDGRHIDWIANKAGQPTPDVLSKLLTLELRGAIKQLPGKRFVRLGD